MNAHNFDSDWDYKDSLLDENTRKALHIIENDLLTDDDWECIVEEYWEDITTFLEETGRTYDWLVKGFEEDSKVDAEPDWEDCR